MTGGASSPSGRVVESRGGVVKILVVDDAADIRLFVSAVLEGAGHQVMTAEDPMKAISLLSVAEIDVLVLDVMMPRFTGFEMLEILRRDTRTRLLPVLLLSSLSETRERVRGLRLGATDFLPKPFDPDELILRLERMVEHRAVSPGGLTGDLDEADLSSVLLRLERESKSGTMCVTSEERRGWLELWEGRVGTARYGLLSGDEAMLAMLLLRQARFIFEPAGAGESAPADEEQSLDVLGLASKAVRMEDELGQLSDELPAENASLFVVRPPSTGSHPARDLPFQEIYDRIEALPGITLEELVAHELSSPIKVRLAVAVLARAAVIEAVVEGTGEGGSA